MAAMAVVAAAIAAEVAPSDMHIAHTHHKGMLLLIKTHSFDINRI
jgi:hypothetical protein